MEQIEYFKRYEQKYRMDEGTYNRLRKALEGRMAVDQYGVSTIQSIYLDTPDHRMIRSSLEKPDYKEKLRLRCYGPADARGMAFLEIKKKYDGVVYKRREAMRLADAERYLLHGCRPADDSQILREIDYMRAFYPELKPACYIGCTRVAMYGLEDPSLRLTFDWDIRWRTDHLSLLQGTAGAALTAPGERLMEVKVSNAMPLWMVQLFCQLQLYPTSFSKYGAAYVQERTAPPIRQSIRIQTKGQSIYA